MKLKFAVICASNQNRSMEAHNILKNEGFDVNSYGTNTNIKIPGIRPDIPNTYPFGTPNKVIYDDLIAKDEAYYRKIGLLNILERNIQVKESSERFQSAPKCYDVIITCDEKCYEIVFTELMKNVEKFNINIIVNFDIKDTPEDAIKGGNEILKLAKILEEQEDYDKLYENIDQIIDDLTKNTDIKISYTIGFY